MEDSDRSLSDIVKALSSVPAFAVHMQRLANSPFYGFPLAIDTIDKAVSVIGTSQIRNLALSLLGANSFAGLSNDFVSMDNS